MVTWSKNIIIIINWWSNRTEADIKAKSKFITNSTWCKIYSNPLELDGVPEITSWWKHDSLVTQNYLWTNTSLLHFHSDFKTISLQFLSSFNLKVFIIRYYLKTPLFELIQNQVPYLGQNGEAWLWLGSIPSIMTIID